MKRLSSLGAAALAATVLYSVPSFLLAQGSLTPPGAPAPTMKTLDQIEPRIDVATLAGDASAEFILAQPGSYYLAANVAAAKTTAIRITVAGVTLDLNGFEISRASGSGGVGISVGAAAQRVTVRNGTINGNFTHGISCIVGSQGTLLENIAVSACTTIGILAQDGAVLRNCRAHDNPGGGMQAGPAATISHCTASNNQINYGILGRLGTTISHCTVTNHTGVGGIGVQSGGVIADSAVYLSTLSTAAIRGETGTTITRCGAYTNTTPAGIGVLRGSTVSHCTARANTSSASISSGISTANACTVVDCTSDGNMSTAGTLTGATGAGISVGGGSGVTNCVVNENTGDGIRFSIGCAIRGNTAEGNGAGAGVGAGLAASGADNRVDGNSATNNDVGIDINAAGSLIIRNSASGNTTSNYEIVASNRYGPIIDITPGGTAAVSGNSAADTTTSTHPWANFAY